MNLNELRTLVDYHYWARDRLMQAVEQLTPEQLSLRIESSFPSVRDTLVHLWGAEVIWLGRWEGHSPTELPGGDDLADLASIARAWAEEEGKLRALLERLGEDGVVRTMEYRMFDGKAYVQPFWQMLLHLVNHGSYHRGQVTTMLRQLAVQPPKQMDFSAFCRENTAARA
jgi:uncharacterized damage-inducible protein DinB